MLQALAIAGTIGMVPLQTVHAEGKTTPSSATIAADPCTQYLAIAVGSDARFNLGAHPNAGTCGAQSGSFNLSYAWPDAPWSSFSTVQVDGNNYVYGTDGSRDSAPTDLDSLTNQSAWHVTSSVKTTQTLKIVSGPSSGKPDTALITYDIVNQDSVAHTIGMRVMIDTMLSDNDGAPFFVPGAGRVTTERDFQGAQVPPYWQAFYSLTSSPEISSQGTLSGDPATQPDRFVIAAWPDIWDTTYDFTPSPGTSVTDDSAVAIYWNARSIPAGGTLHLATLYGLPGFSQDLAPPLALVVTGPVALSANGQGYSPNPFTVTAFTENLGTDTATSTTLSLTLPPGLALAGGDTAVHGLGDLAPGATTSTAWQVTASAQASQTVLTYLVTADATNAPSKVVSRSITLPAVATNAINDVIFVHGWHSSASDAQRGTGYAPLTRPLIDRYGTNYRALAVYQDLAYATPTGCDPAMPSPDMDTQGLKAHPDSINANVCDSEGALAYAASDLDDLVQRLQGPVAIISNSLGGGIVRGWLVLAQERSNDSSLDRVSTVIFTQGTQQGVFWTRLDQQTKESFGAFGQSLFRWVASKIGYDVTKPAAQDVVPQGAWYQSVNPVKPLPSQLHYYNFYSDIKVHFVQYCFIWKCGDLGTDDVGDTALLPGDPDPAKMPPDGGSRFLPGLHNAPDRHEFLWTNTYEEPLTSDGETNPWTGAAAAAFYDVTHDPGIHPAYIDNGANGSVLVDSCTGAGRVTPVEKILYILDHPANGCSS